MSKLMFACVACSLVALTACRRHANVEELQGAYLQGKQMEFNAATEAAEKVCKAMREKDAGVLKELSHCDDLDVASFIEMSKIDPDIVCSDFVVVQEFKVVKFKINAADGGETPIKEGRLTLFNENGQWKCAELDKAKALRQQMELRKQTEEKASAPVEEKPATSAE